MNGHTLWNNRDKESSSKSRQRSNVNGERKRNSRKPVPRPHETEEEAILRRFHDAQRMARFRAKRKKAIEEAKALEAAKLTEIAMIAELKRRNVAFEITSPVMNGQQTTSNPVRPKQQESPLTVFGQSKYSQLLSVIEELGKDIRLTYAGSRTSAERLKMSIIQARMLVRDCLLETEINSGQ